MPSQNCSENALVFDRALLGTKAPPGRQAGAIEKEPIRPPQAPQCLGKNASQTRQTIQKSTPKHSRKQIEKNKVAFKHCLGLESIRCPGKAKEN